MLKKFSLIIFCMFLMACSNTMTVTDYSEKDEVVKQVITMIIYLQEKKQENF